MFYFTEALVVLLCATCCHTICSICVTSENGTEKECLHHHVIHKLSDLTVNETSCNDVRIYLTSGTHILQENLMFSDSVEDTAIHGATHDQPAIIECWNKTGIRFSENRRSNKVFISNIVLSHCHTTLTTSWDLTSQAALYFHNALYTISNVAVMYTVGYGLYANQCREQVVINCTFSNNTEGHIQVMNHHNDIVTVVINITNTIIRDGCSGGLNVSLQNVHCIISINNCKFHSNNMGHLILISEHYSNTNLLIENSVIATSKRDGASIDNDGGDNPFSTVIRNSTFSNNDDNGLMINSVSSAHIMGCSFNNNFNGLTICDSVVIEISKSVFINNSEALYLGFGENYCTTVVSECNFTDHRTNSDSLGIVQIKGDTTLLADAVTLEKCSFERNQGLYGDCSVLFVCNNRKLTLSNVNIADNNCTGITLYDSIVRLENTVNLTRNHGLKGGALKLLEGSPTERSSMLSFSKSSKLNIINNTADTYGGGIYSDKKCANYNYYNRLCFFDLVADFTIVDEVFTFSGNSAELGGDAVFGGCLSDCWVEINASATHINKNDPNNTFWALTSSRNVQSFSNFLAEPRRAVFCANTSTQSVTCHDSYTVRAYRGETFTVPLMVTDDFCTPSVEVIEAKVYQETEGDGDVEIGDVEIERDSIQESRKYCYNFSYTLKGGITKNTTKIAFSMQKQDLSKSIPVLLTVQLKDCPTGYEINEQQCDCQDVLRSYKIQCSSSTYSLKIPALTWMGKLREESGSIGVQRDCQYCNKEATLTITNITKDSDVLCITNRTGILCEACAEGYSLQLGGYECADCSNSTHIGVLLLVAFFVIGIALVLLLLGLNLTVSTGMINGLIFYSNIVYLNSDALLPITREGNSHLQNAVKLLSTFLAWMNLDFGITTCFFDGYDTYISTWMQFVFPLYIWLLILAIVLASRYSSRISKIITSNTVSVLATLLLLAYAKLLKTSIESFSSMQVQVLDGKFSRKLWKSDANISYLGLIHLPLFLMSLVMLLAYILPFTLLILLGPLLQAKSHYRVLNWINKLKPFLDAFYGPYTRRYRYWPGIMLLARLAILCIFAFYSPNDIAFKLVSISVTSLVLLVSWITIRKKSTLSVHRKTFLNYIELFFLLDLGVFAIASVYATQFSTNKTRNQQGLAVAMVGSVLAVSCAILVYHIYHTISKFRAVRNIILNDTISKFRAVRKIKQFIPIKKKGKDDDKEKSKVSRTPAENTSTKVTHTLVKMAECDVANVQLREPLLIMTGDHTL